MTLEVGDIKEIVGEVQQSQAQNSLMEMENEETNTDDSPRRPNTIHNPTYFRDKCKMTMRPIKSTRPKKMKNAMF